jgi:hypothetical protein
MWRRTVLLRVFLVAFVSVFLIMKASEFRENGASAALGSDEGGNPMFMSDFTGHTQMADSKTPACTTHVGAPLGPSDGDDNLTSSVGPLDGDPVPRTTLEGVASQGWHQEAHDAQHTGSTPQDVPMPWVFKWQWNGSCSDGSDCRPSNPDQGWSFEVPPKSHLVAGDGRLYLPAGEHGVWAITEVDGRTAWHNSSVESFCTAAFDPETNFLFVAAGDCNLYRLDPSNGRVIGSFRADSGLNLAPTIVADRVYVVSDNGTLYAINKNTMKLAWAYSAGSRGHTPAAYSESRDVLVFGTADLYIHAVNNSDGSRRWRVKPTVHDPPIYYYTHGWPVIAEQHGIVLMRLRMERVDAFTVPAGGTTYPDTNGAIRSFLQSNPDKQCLFALNLDDGSTAFTPVIGPGGMERPDKEHSMGPQPVVKRYSNGDEVVYTIWRNRLNCVGYFENHPNKNYDAGMCEMVLDDSTVPGYGAGDCRFVQFKTPLTVDEMCFVSMAGPTIMYSHFVELVSHRITDRSHARGDTYDNAIRAEQQYPIINRLDGNSECKKDTTTHFCPSQLRGYCSSRWYVNGGFWVFWNCFDPPFDPDECMGAYSGGMKPRYAIANNGTIYYELNGGAIFAVKSGNELWAEVDKKVRPVGPSMGDTITYTLRILGNGLPLTLADTLPDGLGTPGPIVSTLSEAAYDAGRRLVTWNGTPDVGQSVTIQFPVAVQVDGSLALINTAVLTDADGRVVTDTATSIVDPRQFYFPLATRSH